MSNKRKFSDNDGERKSKRQKHNLNFSYVINDQWVPISKTRNASLKDYCLDYFDMYNIKNIDDIPIKSDNKTQNKIEKESFLNFLFSKGNEFEKIIIEKIKNKFPDDVVQIGESYEAKSVDKYKKTLECMKKRIPIIYQGVLHNTKNKTYGSVDLIVRTDYLSKLVKNKPLCENADVEMNDEEKGFEYTTEYKFPYCIIDIKWSQIHFNSNFSTIRNTLNVKPFKTQIILYNLALDEAFQRIGINKGYPNYCYILGKGWIHERTVKKEKITQTSEDPFDRLGVIDIEDNDKEYLNVIDDAVKWYRKLVYKGDKWKINPPNNKYLYPNMSNTLDYPYHYLKQQIADKYFEITDVWQCGVNHREYALDQDINNWNDPDLTADTLGINGVYTKNIVNKILEVNRGESKDAIYPDKFKYNNGNWKDNDLKLYIDFETISSLFFDEKDYKEMKDHKENEMKDELDEKHGKDEKKDEKKKQKEYKEVIFMIGLGIRNGDTYTRESFIIDDLSVENRRNMIISFIKKINSILIENKWRSKEIPLFHFGCFEKYTFVKTLKFLNINMNRESTFEFKFIDLNDNLKRETFAIKGCLNYGLKSIIKAMNKLGLTELDYKENKKIANGTDAMFHAWKYYTFDKKDKTMIELIDKYNAIDCKALDELMMKIMMPRK